MTRNYRQKKIIRAHAAQTGRTYADAATSLRGRQQGTAAQLRDDLAAALQAAGWPMEIEPNPQGSALPMYAGPATIHISREAAHPFGATGDEHPDDPDVFDQTAPLTVTLWSPSWAVEYSEELGRVPGVDAHEIPGNRPVADIVAEIDRVIGQARVRDLADLPANTGCGICGDSYPAGALFESARVKVRVCPCCAFDGDLLGPRPAQLAFHIDRAAAANLTTPAGWAAAQTLLSCLAGPELLEQLHHDWRAGGTFYLPRECWGEVLTTWIWLPPADRRPVPLADLGCGATLGRVIDTINHAHPGLRDGCRARLDQDDREFLSDQYGNDAHDDRTAAQDRIRVPDATFDRIWPAVVAYAVAMLTQQAERLNDRAPWHVLESFELCDWVDAVDSDLDYFHVEALLYCGINTVRDTLDPRESGSDAY
jgi:hypothetical protein